MKQDKDINAWIRFNSEKYKTVPEKVYPPTKPLTIKDAMTFNEILGDMIEVLDDFWRIIDGWSDPEYQPITPFVEDLVTIEKHQKEINQLCGYLSNLNAALERAKPYVPVKWEKEQLVSDRYSMLRKV